MAELLPQCIQSFHVYFMIVDLRSPFFTWKPVKGSKVNNADPDHTPDDVVSDEGLNCLLT